MTRYLRPLAVLMAVLAAVNVALYIAANGTLVNLVGAVAAAIAGAYAWTSARRLERPPWW